MTKTKTYVVVVDDDESFARALGRLLRTTGFDVHTYPSAEAFLAEKPLPAPDCLLLDIHLGGMSGLELQRKLGELGVLTPVVFVTAHDAPEVREEALQGGCVAYLRKPVARQVLLDAIEKAIHRDDESTAG